MFIICVKVICFAGLSLFSIRFTNMTQTCNFVLNRPKYDILKKCNHDIRNVEIEKI